jgi:hypothetical protein
MRMALSIASASASLDHLRLPSLALHDLPAPHRLAGQQPRLDLGAHRLAPALDEIDLGHAVGQHVGAFGLRRGDGAEKLDHLGAQCRAGGLGPAPAAGLLAGVEQRIGVLGEAGSFEHPLAEVGQVVDGQRCLADGAEPRLVDHHAHAVEVLRQAEFAERGQRVDLQLLVVLGVDSHAAPILQIDHDQLALGQDHRVGWCRARRPHR